MCPVIDGETLHRTDFDSESKKHWHQISKQDLESLLAHRSNPRFQRLVFFAIGGNTYREGYNRFAEEHPDMVIPEIHNKMPAFFYVGLTGPEALLLGDEHNVESERARERTECVILSTLRKKMFEDFAPDGSPADWQVDRSFTPAEKCQIVKVLGINCSTKQAAGDVEQGTAGGPKIYNWYHRIRAIQASDEIWSLMMQLESQKISEDRAKHAQDWRTAQARGRGGRHAPKVQADEQHQGSSHQTDLYGQVKYYVPSQAVQEADCRRLANALSEKAH
jgi:hypothetical protein